MECLYDSLVAGGQKLLLHCFFALSRFALELRIILKTGLFKSRWGLFSKSCLALEGQGLQTQDFFVEVDFVLLGLEELLLEDSDCFDEFLGVFASFGGSLLLSWGKKPLGRRMI